jgi:hypothetical protein
MLIWRDLQRIKATHTIPSKENSLCFLILDKKMIRVKF